MNADEALAAIRESDRSRFLAFVDKETTSGCWRWTGARLKANGYPQFRFHGRTHYAKRVAWELWKSQIKVGTQVFSGITCRLDKLCVNPDHAIVGTAASYYATLRLAQKKINRIIPKLIDSLKHLERHEAPCFECDMVDVQIKMLEELNLPMIRSKPRHKTMDDGDGAP